MADYRLRAEMDKAPEILVSVVVPCRNERGFIGALLDNILGQIGVPGMIEVIISDGMSTDGTRDIVEAFIADNPQFKLLDNPAKTTAAALNIAIESSRGQYVARMDVHTVYGLDYLAKCLEVSQATGAANVGGPARTRATGLKSRAIAAAYGSRFAVGNASFHFLDIDGEVDTVPYGFWKAEVLAQIGPFDEALVRNQDDELNFRTRRLGMAIWQSPEIVSWYCPRDSLRMLFKQYFQYGYWKTVVIRKHGVPASWRHLIPGTFVISLLVLVVTSLIWPPLGYFLGFQVLAYGAFLVAGAVVIARKEGWDLLFPLPVAIAVFHLGYGLGFLSGLVHGFFGGRNGPASLSR